jgi:phosphatidylglycerol---prolipoprotein diacylglyceryl transferase
MGQWLCVPMVIAGIVLWLWAQTRQPVHTSGRVGKA